MDPDLVQSKMNLYSMSVIAFDGGIGENQRRTSVLVNITIQDVNNKAPIFVDPGLIHLKENTAVIFSLLQTRALLYFLPRVTL